MSAAPLRVTVYASSSERIAPAHAVVAEALGRCIAERGWDLVWGGGRYGLMGAVSRGARAAGGRTIGVILQQFVDKNVHCEQAHSMQTVHDMRSRKRGLDESGDAYVALPGGLGTLEELLEILSFKQLGLHDKPVVVLDALGYWGPLLAMLEKGFAEGFIQPHFRGIYEVAATAEEAVERIAQATRRRPAARTDAPPPDPRGGGTG
ncbi:MAG: TIGR00730 family Rossman fold protein [Planctomycetes bacterium]|nr:TIGR00730 family Rossman fold protein [Planctomycetota bacterium]MCB9885587.1 TIGR00730 family Rossman fold protein [Planctomycetota bacterium]